MALMQRAALRSGYDVRHGLIGPGVYASHGYERSHVDGAKNTFLLLKGYLDKDDLKFLKRFSTFFRNQT